MVYIDGTEQSITAAQYAICCARYFEARFLAVYVIDTRALNELRKARIFLEDEEISYEHDLESDAVRYLNYVRQLASAKGVGVETMNLKGTIHQEISKAVKEQNIDLLFIGELSRIRSRRDEFYDETERAMRTAGCTVVIVKDEEQVLRLYEALS